LTSYLFIKHFKERQIPSKYRLSDHDLEIERKTSTSMDRERESRGSVKTVIYST